MPYEVLEEKLKEIPEEYFGEVNSFFDFLLYKIQTEQSKSESLSKKEEKIQKINKILSKIPQNEQLLYCDVGIETVREALKNDTW